MDYAVVALAGFLAFYIKGVSGVGTTTVLLAISSLVIDPKLAIVLTAFANIFGGLAMIKVDPVSLARVYWVPIAVLMLLGSIAGAIMLKIVPNDVFKLILGVVFLLCALWFFLRKPKAISNDNVPVKASVLDLIVGAFAGLSGGFVGVNAPIVVTHLGSYLNKQVLRRLLVLIYLPAAITQTFTYVGNGLFTSQILLYGIVLLPGLVLGIYVGNKAHYMFSEKMFRQFLGVFLIVVSLRMIF